MWKSWLGFLLLILILAACKSPKLLQNQPTLSKAEEVINNAIKVHGGAAYPSSAFEFDFRGKHYTFTNNQQSYQYTTEETTEDGIVKDVLTNTSFTRTLNGQPVHLSSSDSIKYSNSLNSVIYFVLLPYKLIDPAVLSTYKGLTKIKGQTYHTLEIAFKQEGGGTDFEDVFYYWIDQDSYTVDYLAYLYHVNKGGVRFREAIDQKQVDGIRFQNYVNYKADKGTPLADLPSLFEAGNLKKLSVIESENIQALVK